MELEEMASLWEEGEACNSFSRQSHSFFSPTSLILLLVQSSCSIRDPLLIQKNFVQLPSVDQSQDHLNRSRPRCPEEILSLQVQASNPTLLLQSLLQFNLISWNPFSPFRELLQDYLFKRERIL